MMLLSNRRDPRVRWAMGVGVCLWCAVLVGAWPAQAADALLTLADEVRQREAAYAAQATPAHAKQLATAYNNHGVALADAGQLEAGIAQLRRALALTPDRSAITQNLSGLLVRRAQELVEARKAREAQPLLEESLRYYEPLAGAWVLLGHIHYEAQRLADAERAWVRALELRPQATDIAQRLDRLRQERAVEQPFRRLSQAHFDIRYDAGLPADTEHQLREVLLDARRLIGQDFGHYPSQKVTVLLYAPEQFRQIRQQTPEWTAGMFDGKLRLPVMTDPRGATFRRTIWHEYTHLIVHELSGGRCPTWLNEGLAEYEGARQEPGTYQWLRRALAEDVVVPLPRLHARFADLHDSDAAFLAYEQSQSVVAFLIERYGLWRLKRLLKALGQDVPFEEAFYKEFRLKLPQLEQRWREWVATTLAAPTS